MSFLSGENIRDSDNDGRTSSTLSPGRSGGRRGRGYFFNDADTSGGDETDEVLHDARDKLREGLRLGGTVTTEQRLSPRRLFNDLDPDGIGEVKRDSMNVIKGGRVACLML